jgi:hypothetical protein
MKLYLFLTFLLVVLTLGCVNDKFACNSPYILVGNNCCLDRNSNKICDSDEISLTATSSTSTSISTTVTLSTSTTTSTQPTTIRIPTKTITKTMTAGSLAPLKYWLTFERMDAANIWVNSGDPVEITMSFLNRGEEVSATFKGTVITTFDGSIVSFLEGDAISVLPREQVDITAEFTPQNPGRYIIKGKIYYADEATGEKSLILNVLEKQ